MPLCININRIYYIKNLPLFIRGDLYLGDKMNILKRVFSKKVDIKNIPMHIAIIMDGNGRWAKKRGLPRAAGHKAGAETLVEIAKTCSELGVKFLTVYAFSTENWSRPKSEVDYLMDLFSEYLQKFSNDEKNKDIKLVILGDIKGLPKNIQLDIIKVQEITKNNMGLQLNLAVNYGGRDEILNAVKQIASDVNAGKIDITDINNEQFSSYLYTKDIPNPELIIRTSGEMRLSNFLLYQCAYSEFWFCKINWPDFNRQHLLEAIADYEKRHRRFGGI